MPPKLGIPRKILEMLAQVAAPGAGNYLIPCSSHTLPKIPKIPKLLPGMGTSHLDPGLAGNKWDWKLLIPEAAIQRGPWKLWGRNSKPGRAVFSIWMLLILLLLISLWIESQQEPGSPSVFPSSHSCQEFQLISFVSLPSLTFPCPQEHSQGKYSLMGNLNYTGISLLLLESFISSQGKYNSTFPSPDGREMMLG